MQDDILKIDDEFHEIGTRSIDDRSRITLGEFFKGSKRVRLYKNDRGEILLQPLVEIPSSEIWLYRNNDALDSVQRGLKDAAEGKISKLDPDKF